MFEEVDAFQRGVRAQRDVGLPVEGVQRAFEICINQQRSRARGYYGSVLYPVAESPTTTSADVTTMAETTATRIQTARRGRRSARPTTSSTRVDRSAGVGGISRSSSPTHEYQVVHMPCSDGDSRENRMDTEPEDWGSDDPFL
jgi:hypothetical protein